MSISIPKFIKTIFASSGIRRDVPETLSPSSGDASYTFGFPSRTMIPEEAGGIPPNGKDFNGLFYDLTSNAQYLQAGKLYPYNQEFATSIGGYDIGAAVLDPTDSSKYWASQVNGNTNPPSEANGWIQFGFANATESIYGFTRYATQSQVDAGAIDGRSISPLKLKFGFSVSLTANGFIQFPSWLGGIIFQWGSASGAADYVITYPKQYSSAVFFNTAICQGGIAAAPNDASFAEVYTNTTSQFAVHCYRAAPGGVVSYPRGIQWFSIGK